jgi:hypothetical protein
MNILEFKQEYAGGSVKVDCAKGNLEASRLIRKSQQLSRGEKRPRNRMARMHQK